MPVVLELPFHSPIIFDLQKGVFSRFESQNTPSLHFSEKGRRKRQRLTQRSRKVFKDFRKEAASWKSDGPDKFYISVVTLVTSG